MVKWEDFAKIDMRVGTVLTAEPFPEARTPAFKMTIDFGNKVGIKKSSAQITDFYTAQDLVGSQVVAVVNFPPRQIGPFVSECLVMGAYNEQKQVVLVRPDRAMTKGSKMG